MILEYTGGWLKNLTISTRPNIAYPVSVVSWFMSDPRTLQSSELLDIKEVIGKRLVVLILLTLSRTGFSDVN